MSKTTKIFGGILLALAICVIAYLIWGQKVKPRHIIRTAMVDAGKLKDESIDDTSMANRHDYYAITREINDNRIYIAMPGASVYNAYNRSKTIATLLPGDTVSLVEQQDYPIAFFSDSIYNIRFFSGNIIQSGFINGAYLGRGGLKSPGNGNDSQLLVVHYISYSSKDGSDNNIDVKQGIAEIDLIKDHTISSKLIFNADNLIGLYKFKPATSFSGLDFYLLEYGYEACGYTHGQVLLYDNGIKIDSISMQFTMNEAGVSGNYIDYFFPNDSGGKPGKIVEVNSEMSYDDNGKQSLFSRDIDEYRFTGHGFVRETKR